MRVTFVGSAQFKLASYRYRALMPCTELQALGVDCQIMTAYDGLNADVFVFSKHFNPYKDQEALMKIKEPGFMAANQIAVVAEDRPQPKTVFDVCDDHFDDLKHGQHYHFMCENADAVIASTSRMAEIIKEKTGRDAIVINDPFEYPEKEPRYKWEQNEVQNVLWFGHGSNLHHLLRVWDDMKGQNIMIITDGVEITDKATNKPFPIVPWSHENMMHGLAQSDVVVLPNNGEKCHKGGNRMIEAIRQGVFVIAEPHPEYNRFKEWMFIGDIGKGLEWTKSNKKHMKERIKNAQKFVSANYHPQTIGRTWMRALNSIWGVESKSGQDGSTSTNMTGAGLTSQTLPGAL
jgi:hypothetical protein